MGIPVPQLQAISFSTVDLLIALSLGFLLGLWMVFIYRVTHRGLTYERSFLVSLAMVPPIVGLIMMLIGSNLALSLGMVGALSIIRFRTVIKDSRDMVYLFWAIAIGLGAGTSNWMATIIASAFIGAVLLILHFVQYGKMQHSDFVLVVNGEGEKFDQTILGLVSDRAMSSSVRSMEMTGEGWEIVLEIRFEGVDPDSPQQLLESIRDMPSIRNVSLLAPHLSLPI